MTNWTRVCKRISRYQFISYGVNNNHALNCNGLDVKSDIKEIHLGHIIGPDVKSNIILDASHSFTRSVMYGNG